VSRRVLVTGASGFVGANLARRLLNDGPQHNPWRVQEIRDQVTVHQGDVSDLQAVEKAMAAAKPEWVFHLAAHGAYPDQKDFDQMVATNVRGTANLLRAAEQSEVEAFVSAGTSSEYGYKDHAPSEDEWLEPNSDYAVTKAAATHMSRLAATATGARIATLRLYSAYGPYEEPRRLVPTLIVQGLAGKLPPLVNPDIARDYVHVEDISSAFVLVAATPNQEPGVVYNVGSGVQTTLRQIVDATRRLLKVEAAPVWGSMPERSWDTNVWVSNPARITTQLGWTPRHDLESGLRQTIDWFKQHPDQLDRYRHGIE